MKEKSDNELIAEFMGGQDLIWYHTLLDRDRECDYHSNWSRLMPVVEKINTICDLMNEERQEHKDIDDPAGWRAWSYRRVKLTTDIHIVYQSVVSFIKWYNESQ